jgi:hypothetical protein
MNNKIKTYKIMVDSKPFANIRGSTPAEVAKKAASKILSNSLNHVRFSVQEKTGKIRHYNAKRENLVRPYHKNGKLVKYRIIVKKIGKQVGGTYSPNLEPGSKNPIFDFFPRGEYDVSFNEYFTIFDKKKNICIAFYIIKNDEDNYLYINDLYKCSYQGKKNLDNLIKYARELKKLQIIDKIVLDDASYIIEPEIQLWLLSILINGESWYNKFKFKSDDYDKEILHNKSIIIMNFEDFINECISLVIINRKEMYSLNNSKITDLDNQLNEQKKIFFSFYDKTKSVQEIFTQIKKELEGQISEEKKSIIKSLLSMIQSSRIIMYNKNLTLTL